MIELMRKDLRRYYSVIGWTLLVYYLIMNVGVLIGQIMAMIFAALGKLHTHDWGIVEAAALDAASSALGYFLAAGAGLAALLYWKKPSFWRYEIWAKGKQMHAGDFLCLVCIFLGAQTLYGYYASAVEGITNVFGYSLLQGFEQMMGDDTKFSMFLYTGMLAPVAEELLFRGLILRMLLPHGKRFAILGSAFTFGMFHGNLLQTPFAFLSGLVMGYVACEYSIGWSMLLHMINNLVIADLFARVLSPLPGEVGDMVFGVFILAVGIAGLVILLARSKEVKEYFRRNPINRECVRCFFSSGGVITFNVIMGLMLVFTFFAFLVPI